MASVLGPLVLLPALLISLICFGALVGRVAMAGARACRVWPALGVYAGLTAVITVPFWRHASSITASYTHEGQTVEGGLTRAMVGSAYWGLSVGIASVLAAVATCALMHRLRIVLPSSRQPGPVLTPVPRAGSEPASLPVEHRANRVEV